MNTILAEEYALDEVMHRLKQLPVFYDHDPLCECNTPNSCPKRCKMVRPTEHAIQPYKDYQIALADATKTHIKKLLKSKLSVTTEPLEYVFVTVNPKPSVTLPDFVTKFEKFISTKIFSKVCAVIEQRGKPPPDPKFGTGYHCHILFKRHTPLTKGLPPTNFKQKIRQSWKNFCEASNDKILNIQVIHHTYALDKLEYMLGIKTKPGKEAKQRGDKQWRPIHNIPEFYGDDAICDI